MNNSYNISDLVLLNQDSKKVNIACRLPLKFASTPSEHDLSCDHAYTSYFMYFLFYKLTFLFQVRQAVTALKEFLEKHKRKTPALLDEYKIIRLQLSLKKIPPAPKKINM